MQELIQLVVWLAHMALFVALPVWLVYNLM